MRYLPGRIVYLVCVCLGLFAVLTAHGAELTQDPVEAVWRAQRLMFEYRSEGAMYRCDALKYKITMILQRLGARERLQVHGVKCRDFAGMAQFEVFMESPVAATAENIRDITHYNSKDELIARLRGMPLALPEDLERFPAVWETISFRGGGKLRLEDHDCALVQQLRRQVLPNMSVQVIKDINRLDCSHSTPRLTVMALVATDGKSAGGDAQRAAVDRIGRVDTLSASNSAIGQRPVRSASRQKHTVAE